MNAWRRFSLEKQCVEQNDTAGGQKCQENWTYESIEGHKRNAKSLTCRQMARRTYTFFLRVRLALSNNHIFPPEPASRSILDSSCLRLPRAADICVMSNVLASALVKDSRRLYPLITAGG